MDSARKADQPFDRLTGLCKVMTDALDRAVEAEEGEHLPVRAIVFLEDDEKGGIVTSGYEDTIAAMAAVFVHIKAIFQAEGKDLDFIGIPDSPEGISNEQDPEQGPDQHS